MDVRKDGQTDGRMDGWVDGRMDGPPDGWRDLRMDGAIYGRRRPPNVMRGRIRNERDGLSKISFAYCSIFFLH